MVAVEVGRLRIAGWTATVTTIGALNYLGRAESGRPPDDVVYRWSTGLGGLILAAIIVGVVYWLGAGLDYRELLALRQPSSWPLALGLATAGLIVIFVGATLLLRIASGEDEQNLTPDTWDGSRAGPYILSFIAIAIAGPIAEELLYRGAGISLLQRFGIPTAIVVTAVVFGLGHGLLLALAPLVLFGLVTASLRVWTRSLYPCILVHCVFNGLGLTVPLFV